MNNSNLSTSRSVRSFSAAVVGLLVLSGMLPSIASADILFRQLSQGMSGADVSTLQTFLATDPTIYPQGLVTGFFGPLTFAAVSNFQSKNGIATVGRVGPTTLAAINRLNGSIGGTNDVSAPIISNINLSTSANAATIGWSTNGVTQGTLYYSSSWLTLTENSAANPDTVSVNGTPIVSSNFGLQSSHSVQMQNLSANTVYYYVIHATDQAGNVSVTWPASFRTNQ